MIDQIFGPTVRSNPAKPANEGGTSDDEDGVGFRGGAEDCASAGEKPGAPVVVGGFAHHPTAGEDESDGEGREATLDGGAEGGIR
jgi:hypothetical protein